MDEYGICCYLLHHLRTDRLMVASAAHGALLMALQFQSLQSNNQVNCALRAAAAAAMLGVVAAAALPLAAQAAEGPFSALAGSWSGGGMIKKSNGTGERIRCRAAYEPSGANLGLRLRCASDSYNFDLSAQVAYQGGTISGSWQEATRSVSGPIQGRSAGEGRQIQASTQAIGFSANISLNTKGNHQSVLIVAPGAEVPEVTVSLEKK
jgi:hypothetical protein